MNNVSAITSSTDSVLACPHASHAPLGDGQVAVQTGHILDIHYDIPPPALSYIHTQSHKHYPALTHTTPQH